MTKSDGEKHYKDSHFIAVMDALQAEANIHPHVDLNSFFKIMGSEGHAVLLIFLTMPYMQPIPIPGLSTPFGVLISIVSVFLFLDRPAYLPKRFHHHKLSSEMVKKVTEFAEKVWARIHRRIYARWDVVFTSIFFRILTLLVMVTCGLLLALPLPIPFSNTVPAIVIMLNSLGQMEKDGLFVALSYVACLFCFAFFVGLSMGTANIFSYFS